jgi:hypothetical protein
MHNLILFQGLYSEYGSRQWLETMELLVTTYFGVALGFVGFIVICAILLAVLEWRQRSKPVCALGDRRQKEYAPKRQPLDAAGFEPLMIEHPSLF